MLVTGDLICDRAWITFTLNASTAFRLRNMRLELDMIEIRTC